MTDTEREPFREVPMRTQLEARLQQLKAEFEAGQHLLAELEAKQANLRETLLRISGAIQVLQEELDKAEQSAERPLEPEPAVVRDMQPHLMTSL
jgi:predicted nuclease with TOPRIM domain